MSIFYILVAVLLFGILIAVHEGGHFAAAKACGVRVNEFSIGMGPLIWSKQGKETLYSLRLFPIGGFCAMAGEDEASDDPRAFINAKAWKRLIILAAGAAMNFLIGLLMILLLYSGAGSFASTTVAGFMEGCPAQGEEFLHTGDRIVKVNGHRVLMYSDFTTLLSRSSSETADLVVERDGQKITLHDVPLALRQYETESGTVIRYGLYFAYEPATLLNRIQYAGYSAVGFVRLVLFGLEDIITGGVGLRDLSGPVGVVEAVTEVGEASGGLLAALSNILYFFAFIAVNLAVMNLLPLPALDGGRIFFLLVNLAAGLFHREIPQKYEGYVHYAGLILLLGLTFLVALSDVAKLFGV